MKLDWNALFSTDNILIFVMLVSAIFLIIIISKYLKDNKKQKGNKEEIKEVGDNEE